MSSLIHLFIYIILHVSVPSPRIKLFIRIEFTGLHFMMIFCVIECDDAGIIIYYLYYYLFISVTVLMKRFALSCESRVSPRQVFNDSFKSNQSQYIYIIDQPPLYVNLIYKLAYTSLQLKIAAFKVQHSWGEGVFNKFI